MPKILDESANVLAETIIEVEAEHRSDGHVSRREQFVEIGLRYSLALMELAIERKKMQTRMDNGMLTKQLLADWRDADEQLRKIREEYPGRTGYSISEDAA